MTRLNEALNYESKYEKNGVLKNKLGIDDQEKLDQVERVMTTYKLANLYLNPGKQTFDVNHLLSIHKYLFDDIYEFAGQIRSENIKKPIPFKPDEVVPFIPPEFIYTQLNENLTRIRKQENNIHNEDDYLEHIADLLSTLDIIHAFREGNGRTEREFVRQYVEYLNTKIDFAEYSLDYSAIEDKDNFISSIVIADLTCNLSYLKNIIKNMLINKKQKAK